MTGGRTTRAERMAMPLARQVVKDLAAEHGACLRPVQLRRTDIDTGHIEQVLIPCGHTLAHVCPSCAERAKTLRAVQCREGWHLENEPDLTPDPATDDQYPCHVPLRSSAPLSRSTYPPLRASLRTPFRPARARRCGRGTGPTSSPTG